MRIPVVRGLIDRRILINFHVDPGVLARVLPPPFRPQQVNGYGIAGVCLIRLTQIRPWFVPSAMGLSSENAAHRIAVEWDDGDEVRTGVYIPRRDTSSRLNTLIGGRLFPGVHHHARFQVDERNDYYRVALDSDDSQTHVAIEGWLADGLPSTSIFRSLDEASHFFVQGSLGYSARRDPGVYDGLELHTQAWGVQPLAVERIESSFFDDPSLFPKGSAQFDCALLMRRIEHEWRGRPMLRTSIPAPAAACDSCN